MSFFAILLALLLEQARPLSRDNLVHAGARAWTVSVRRNFDAGREHHGWVAWGLAVVPPALLAVGVYWLLMRWVGWPVAMLWNVAVLYVTMLLFSLSVSSIGLMVSSFASTQQQAFLGCFTVGVPCILLSGFMTPVNNMPMFLQDLSQLNPLRHFIVILQGLFLKDITMSAALDSSARIAAITAVSMLCAIWMFTRKA